MTFHDLLRAPLGDATPSATQTALCAFVAWLSYLVGLAVYRLYLCPLARFPGPRLAALTYWYEYYYDVHRPGKYIFHIVELHERYGPVVRVNPYELHFNDADFFGEIYHGNRWVTHRDGWYNLAYLGEGLAFTMDHDVHRVRRESLAPYFSMQSVRALEPRITVVVSNMVTRLQRAVERGEVLNLYEMGTAFAMDVITEYSFGKEGASNLMLKDEMGQAWANIARSAIKMNPFARHWKTLTKAMISVPASVMARMSEAMAVRIKWMDDLTAQVDRIMKEGHGMGDTKSSIADRTMFHEMLFSDLPPKDKKLARLADEANMVVGAGGETTAQIMSRTWFHVFDNPRVLARLREELKQAFPDATVMPTIAELQRLPYLLAVVEEGVRISLPVLARSPRVFQDHVLKYGEWSIEPGVAVSMSPYVVSTNASIFPEPFTFKPERWLGDKGKELQRDAVSFGKGKRGCLGKNLGYVELWYAMAVAIRRFDFELHETTIDDVTVTHDYFIGFVDDSSTGVRARVLRELS